MKFTATINKKYIVWQRISITFDAKDETEAEKLLAKHNGVPPRAEYENTETLYETEQPMTIAENGGEAVYEVETGPEEV